MCLALFRCVCVYLRLRVVFFPSVDTCFPVVDSYPRAAHLDGGAAATGHGVETLDILAVVVYPERLLQYLRYCSDARDGNVFPDLGRFVDSIR